ncbi:hypothetical protein CI088_09875 [Enterococcus plantarum]|uniref:MucBP domain-containing protein n=1 Tax=Enterococcus plantarum TaxID=1077675 RepID=A0A2W3YYV0_9ENTE|nr:hypothetical protein [Enterococcus plantarum]PZL72796.1 hypothetical protein CI088_09875 [Enterococcus plantarum]
MKKKNIVFSLILLMTFILAIGYITKGASLEAKTGDLSKDENKTSNNTGLSAPIQRQAQPALDASWIPVDTARRESVNLDETGELQLVYKFGDMFDTPLNISSYLQLIPNVFLRDLKTYPDGVAPGDIQALYRNSILTEEGDYIFGPNTSQSIVLGVKNPETGDDMVYKTFNPIKNSAKFYRKETANGSGALMAKYRAKPKESSLGSLPGIMNFEFELTQVMYPEKGNIRIEIYLKNITPDDAIRDLSLDNVALMSYFDTFLSDNDEVPIRYLGNNRGLYIEQTDALANSPIWAPEPRATYRLNYYFQVPNPVSNWSGSSYSDALYMLKPNGAFDGLNGSGNEADNGIAGTPILLNGIVPPPSYDTAMAMKSAIVPTLKYGDSISYSYKVGLQKISEKPSIILDSNEGFRLTDQGTHKITGQWFDSDSTKMKLYYSIDGGTNFKKFEEKEIALNELGTGIDFSLELSKDLKDEDQEILIYAEDFPEPEKEPLKSEVVTYKLIYVDSNPVIKLDKNNGRVPVDTYKVTGTYIDDDKYKPTTVFYKKLQDPDSQYKEATVINGSESTFEFLIPKTEIVNSDKSYMFAIRAKNKYEIESNVEVLKLSNNPSKPAFNLGSGEATKVLSPTAKSYPITITDFTHIGFYYPLDMQYKIDEVGSWQSIGTKINTTQSSSMTAVTESGQKIEIPASALAFGKKHDVYLKVVDQFGIASDPQKVEFIMPESPVLTVENKDAPSLGEAQVVKGTIQTEYFPAKFQYKIEKNGETGSAYREVADKDLTIDPATGKFSFTIEGSLLPEGASYEIFVKGFDAYSQESAEVSYRLIEVIHFKVKFVNSKSVTIHPEITIDRELGTTIDLALENEVQDTLTKLKKQYTLVDSSIPSTPIDMDSSTAFWEYKFTGRLTYMSYPEAFDFGLEIASFKKIRIDDPKVTGLPLIVSDTRESEPGWSLNVKLTQELLNEDGKTPLKNAVRYKHGDTETILNNQALPVVRKPSTGKYDISGEWSSTGDGLKLEIAPGAVNALGKYHGEMLFELSETP